MSKALQRPTPIAVLAGRSPARAMVLPLGFALLLFALSMLPSVRANTNLLWSLWGAGALLLAWIAALFVTAGRHGRTFTLEVVLRSQHYVQAVAQIAVFVYWGWYWQQVYHSVELIAAQLIFAYAFDSLLTWSKRDTYTLGFGPFPIIFSINLFLWFKPEWFYLQFMMVAVGFLAKEMIRWNKDGRRTHIFNPSSFPLALFSIILILTHQSDITWGEDIAVTQLFPPHMYVLIFLVGLPSQYLFGVGLMTMTAVVTAYLFGVLYFMATGSDVAFGPYIPIAVFLGMHLLFNDPSTSPRTALGRIIFGMLYAFSTFALHIILEAAGYPTFYDKLLQVPIMNLLIQVIDRAARSKALSRLDPTRLVAGVAPQRRNLVYMAVWVVFFAVMQSNMSGRQEVLRNQDKRTRAIDAGKYEEAIIYIHRLAEIHPNNAPSHYDLGAHLLKVGRLREAVAPLQRAIELEPDNAQTHHSLAFALNSIGDVKGAVHHYHEAIRIKPDWPNPKSRLALILARSRATGYRDPQKAVKLASQAVKLDGGRDPWIMDSLAIAYASVGRFAEAQKTAEVALKIAAKRAPELAAQIRARLKRIREFQSQQSEGKTEEDKDSNR